MKKIFIPILASAALAPTIAATSCGGIYMVFNINEWNEDGYLTYHQVFACDDGLGCEFVVDYNYWEGEENSLPVGKFWLVHAEKPESKANDLSENYEFSENTKITIGDKTIHWSFGDSNAEINITDTVSLSDQIVKIRTSITNKSHDLEKVFDFQAR